MLLFVIHVWHFADKVTALNNMTFCLKLIQGQATLSVSFSIKQQPKN